MAPPGAGVGLVVGERKWSHTGGCPRVMGSGGGGFPSAVRTEHAECCSTGAGCVAHVPGWLPPPAAATAVGAGEGWG